MSSPDGTAPPDRPDGTAAGQEEPKIEDLVHEDAGPTPRFEDLAEEHAEHEAELSAEVMTESGPEPAAADPAVAATGTAVATEPGKKMELGPVGHLGDRLFSAFARGSGGLVVLIVAFVGIFLLALAIPALAIWGQTEFVIALGISALGVLAVRRYWIRQLLPGVPLSRLAFRALWPLVPAAAAPLAIRFALWGGHRSLGQAIAELIAFLVTYAAATYVAERGLVRELRQAARV